LTNQEYIERIVASEWYQSFKASQSKKEVKLLWKYIIEDCILTITNIENSKNQYCELFVEDENGIKFLLETAPYNEIAEILKLFQKD